MLKGIDPILNAEVLHALRAMGHDVEVIFLDASDEALLRRFSETRRPHPLGAFGDVLSAIQRERERLGPLRAQARVVFDTTDRTMRGLPPPRAT